MLSRFHSAKGTIVEALGNVTGATSWVDSGKKEHAEGETEITAAKAEGYVEGTVDRVEGKLDAVTGAFTGDEEKQAKGKSTSEI